ncbi:hypothetical protein GOP47_0005452 [Adiantum capillus-veneris]|uniref:Uncharacterized protein n=1 Tax=Adiantum capillus-veneris TaxID=13818 RepID=A0A9D4ZLE1_ADICA|nr:hypothetical protein GOP47_0005452 [Adiantum capillus-veneris]
MRGGLLLNPNLPSTSNLLNTHSRVEDLLFNDLHLNGKRKNKEKLDVDISNNHWKILRGIPVSKVPQDDSIKEVYKDAWEAYYATTRLPRLELPLVHKVLIEKQAGNMIPIGDRWGNEYRTLDCLEVREISWHGKPLFMDAPTQATARLEETAFYRETPAHTMRGVTRWSQHLQKEQRLGDLYFLLTLHLQLEGELEFEWNQLGNSSEQRDLERKSLEEDDELCTEDIMTSTQEK